MDWLVINLNVMLVRINVKDSWRWFCGKFLFMVKVVNDRELINV